MVLLCVNRKPKLLLLLLTPGDGMNLLRDSSRPRSTLGGIEEDSVPEAEPLLAGGSRPASPGADVEVGGDE